MFDYTVRRLLQLVPLLLIVGTITFFLSHLVPGGPARAHLGTHATPETVAEFQAQHGLDRPLLVQYGSFLVDTFVRFDLGRAYSTNLPVAEEVGTRFAATLELALAAMVIAILFGILFGVLAAVYRNSAIDYVSMVGAMAGVSVPIYFLAVVVMTLIGSQTGRGDLELWNDPALRVTGFYLLDAVWHLRWDLLTDAMNHLALPAVVLSTIPMAITARMTRSAMLDVLGADYVRTARAKGVPRHLVVLKHALTNALIPTVTVIGINFGYLLAGAVLTETVFSWPGLGQYIVSAFEKRDYQQIQGGILLVATVFLLVNLAVDLLYASLDPTIEYGGTRAGKRGRLRDLFTGIGSSRSLGTRIKELPATIREGVAGFILALGALKKPMRKFVRNRSAVAGCIILFFFLIGGLFADWIAPYDPVRDSPSWQAIPPPMWPGEYTPLEGDPGAERFFLLGTDQLGRDIFSRILAGARISLFIGLISVGIGLFLGTPLGLIAGYLGGWTDTIISRIVDALLAFPGILLVIAIASLLGPSLPNLMIAVGIMTVPRFIRQVRASVLTVRDSEYVQASRALGVPPSRIMFRVILPNILSPIIVLVTLGFGTAILEAAGFTFLGFGGEADLSEWGNMLSQTRHLITVHPWVPLAPGFAIMVTVLGFNLVGDGLRDALDPKMED